MSRFVHRLPLIASCLLLIPAAFVATPSVVSAAPVTATKLVVIRPFAKNGTLRTGYSVTKRVKGSCWEGSILTNRVDAYRCTTGNFILDPCFSSPTGKKVGCPSKLNPHKVELVRLTKPLPTANKGGARAWEIRLAGGNLCVFVSGASFVLNGMRANFSCLKHNIWAFGSLHANHQPWKVWTTWVSSSNPKKHGKLKLVKIRKAWL